MTVNNPTQLGGFWSRLKIQSMDWALLSATVSSRTESGETITAARGTRLWSGSVTLAPMYHRDAAAIKAPLQLLAGADRSFFCHPPVWSPSVDPGGAIIAGYSPTIAGIAADRIQMRIANLPPLYRLRTGEYLSFAYGSNPTRYALHQIMGDDPIADAVTRQTGLFEVRPAIRPGATVGASVTLYKPVIRAQLIRDSISYGTAQGAVTTGISFSFIQTLRG